MNKYQEALDYIVTATNGANGIIQQINDLQELVDKLTSKKSLPKKELAEKECKKALNYFLDECMIDGFMAKSDERNYDILEQLIEEHFELVKEFESYKKSDKLLKLIENNFTNETYFSHIIKAISKCDDEEIKDYAIHCLSYLKHKLDDFENPKAYKF